jgi:hypothetical protein
MVSINRIKERVSIGFDLRSKLIKVRDPAIDAGSVWQYYVRGMIYLTIIVHERSLVINKMLLILTPS